MEYKFRAKGINNGKWYYGTYFKHQKVTHCCLGYEPTESEIEEDYEHYIIFSGFADWELPKPISMVQVLKETVGMFTGIYDRENKEIFSGDILVDETGRDWIVYLSKGGFRCSRVEEYYSDCIVKIEHGLSEPQNTAWTRQSCKIIGNIYDNPILKDGGENEN